MIPMDETLSCVSIDVSNRPYLIWKVNLPVEKLGEMDTSYLKVVSSILAISWYYFTHRKYLWRK